MTRKQIVKRCKLKLLKLKRDYSRSLERKSNYSVGTSEVIDVANREQQMRSSFHFRGRMRQMMDEVDAALKRIENNTYGICEMTGEPIPEKRLLAVPWTRISIQ